MLTITRGWSLKVKPLDDEGAIAVSLSLDSSLVSFDGILIGFRPGLNSDPRSGSGDIEPGLRNGYRVYCTGRAYPRGGS